MTGSNSSALARVRCVGMLVLVALGLLAPAAQAHEVRPGYLQIQEVEPDVYDLLWKVPARGDFRLGMYVRMPGLCTGELRQASLSGNAFVERWRYACPNGLAGADIRVDGLSATRTDVLVRVEHLSGSAETLRLTPEQTRFTVAEASSRAQVAWTYLTIGIEHILLGIDHLLFVLGLMFLVNDWRRLILTVTAFTIAHSITLAAATLGFISFPQAPVEATIALSVMFVASEILRGRAPNRRGLAARAPWVVAFVFGLLHGFGFAGALHEIGLPDSEIPLALLLFNVGVELGQLLFIAAVVAVLALVTRITRQGTSPPLAPVHSAVAIRTAGAYVIGTLSAFWLIDRVVAFWA